MKTRLGESSELGMIFLLPSKRTILFNACGRKKMAGKTENMEPTWKILMNGVDLGEPTSLLDHVYFGLHSKRMPNKQGYCG